MMQRQIGLRKRCPPATFWAPQRACFNWFPAQSFLYELAKVRVRSSGSRLNFIMANQDRCQDHAFTTAPRLSEMARAAAPRHP